MTPEQKEQMKKAAEDAAISHLVIEFKHITFVLPFKKGMQFIELMAEAEDVDNFSSWEREKSKTKTAPFGRANLTYRPVTYKEYIEWKTREFLIPE